jgi:hypothetical protein
MFTRLRSVRLHSLHSGSLQITSLFFLVVLLIRLRPWLVAMLLRQRLSRPAPYTMLRIVFVAVDRTYE